jgi:glycosyltransferase involved in cell wall biosynthesis
MAERRRLLVVAHYHPELVRGGGQQAAYELFTGFAARPDYAAFFLGSVQQDRHPQLLEPGVTISAYDRRPNEFLFASRAFDPFWMSNSELNLAGWQPVLDFMRELRPDVVHVNHVLHLGIEFLRAARVACPAARLIYTFHEFLPICHANGQMVRTRGEGLCDRASPTRCAVCFPEHRPAEFAYRERLMRAHFAAIDRFVAPSRFLRQRYVEWGIPEQDIVVIDYGRAAGLRRAGQRQPASPKHNRFGFFGQLIDSKGIDCLIDAVARLTRRGVDDFELRIHGTNLDQASAALRTRFAAAFEKYPQLIYRGGYSQSELPRHAAAVDWFVVPSLWWENSPLVIQEAFMSGRPVLCGDVGGMAEKVRDGADGLHFAIGDATSLADAMLRCLGEPELWDRLAAGIPDVLTIEEAVELHRRLCFEGDLPGRAPATAAAPQPG